MPFSTPVVSRHRIICGPCHSYLGESPCSLEDECPSLTKGCDPLGSIKDRDLIDLFPARIRMLSIRALEVLCIRV
jgi:hypothetical protein